MEEQILLENENVRKIDCAIVVKINLELRRQVALPCFEL